MHGLTIVALLCLMVLVAGCSPHPTSQVCEDATSDTGWFFTWRTDSNRLAIQCAILEELRELNDKNAQS